MRGAPEQAVIIKNASQQIYGAVRTTFFKKEQITPSLTPPDSGHVGVNVGVTDEEKELLALIEQHQPINAASLASHYPDVTQRTVER